MNKISIELNGKSYFVSTEHQAAVEQLQSQFAAEKENAIHHQDAHKACSADRVEIIKQLDIAKRENQSFGNVLAVIHRDGGHYISIHGAEKASKDAIKIIMETRTQLVEAKERETRLRDDVQAQRRWQRCPRCYKTFATKT